MLSGKDTASLETPITPAESTKTEPPITGMLIQSDEAGEIPPDPAQWKYSVTKQKSVPNANDFLIVSGAATLVSQQSLGDSLGGEPRGPGMELRSATGHQFTTTGTTTTCLRTRDSVNVQRSIISVGQVCDRGNTITFRSTGGTILNEFTGNRVEFERAGGVYRLRVDTWQRCDLDQVKSKWLMSFEQDTAGAVEAQPARPGIVPVLPSEADVEQHELPHWPWRSWCRHCVRAKGKESPHYESNPGGVSKFATDCMFMGEDGTPITIFAGYDGLTTALFANVAPCKGTSHGNAEGALAHNVLSTGHHKVILQSGQEPSIIDGRHKAGTHIPTEIVYEESPVGDSNANGSIERVIQTIQENDRLVRRLVSTAQF